MIEIPIYKGLMPRIDEDCGPIIEDQPSFNGQQFDGFVDCAVYDELEFRAEGA